MSVACLTGIPCNNTIIFSFTSDPLISSLYVFCNYYMYFQVHVKFSTNDCRRPINVFIDLITYYRLLLFEKFLYHDVFE